MGHRTRGRARRLLLATIVSGALLAQNASAAQGTITTVAGNGTYGFSGDGGPATNAALRAPYGVAVDTSGNLFIADTRNHRVRKVDASGTITTVAGNGIRGFSGDGGPATSATLNEASGVAVDTSGNLFIADMSNNRVRKVDASGTITTVAGNGTRGFFGDGGPATSATLYEPSGVAVDTSGNLFIADMWNNRVRKVDAFGLITTVAGSGQADISTGGVPYPLACPSPLGLLCVPYVAVSLLGDGGPAVAARLSAPTSVTIDDAGNLFIADTRHYRIRKVDASGLITTVAGDGTEGFSGDGGPATSARLSYPYGVAVDTFGNLFIADVGAQRVRKVGASGTITTVAGNGAYGFSGDGGPAANARLSGPHGVALDTSGNLFIADTFNNRVRKVAAG